MMCNSREKNKKVQCKNLQTPQKLSLSVALSFIYGNMTLGREPDISLTIFSTRLVCPHTVIYIGNMTGVDTSMDEHVMQVCMERSKLEQNGEEPKENYENSKTKNLTEFELGVLFARSHNVRKFAVNIVRAIFSEEEMRTSNCTGAREFQQLDFGKLQFVRETVLRYYNIPTYASPEIWKLCCQSIDAHCRHERRLYKKLEANI